jgi:hypothetical protein
VVLEIEHHCDGFAALHWLGAQPQLVESRMPTIIDLAAEALVWVLDGSTTLDIVEDDGPPRSYTLGAGMMVIVPPGTWHRFHAANGATLMSAVVPGENIDLDIDDPRPVVRQPA